MNPLHRAWHWLVTDELKFRRWLRGFLAWLTASMLQMSLAGVDAMAEWPVKKWVIAFWISGLSGVVGLINLGEKNKPAGSP